MIKSENTLTWGVGGAIFVHLLLLIAIGGSGVPITARTQSVTINLDSVLASVSSEPSDIGVEGIVGSQIDESKVADKKREIFLRYLEDIGSCVHENRFLMPGSQDVIGIASYLIRIDGDGMFASVRLRSTSGRKTLDEAGLLAVQSCSNKVKRPPSTGTDPLVVLQEVRYQYKER